MTNSERRPHQRPKLETQTWLQKALPAHQQLSAVAGSLLESLIRGANVEYLSVTHRTKTVDGALEKIHRKGYQDPPASMTDLSGVRVITYIESQAQAVADLVRRSFSVDEQNSADRSSILGRDRVGYRSMHFVCSLGPDRNDLPEYQGIAELKFEIQVRTVLQHAWAELAHDNTFKFDKVLPDELQRKLNLHSAMLEIVDGAFQEIYEAAESYKIELQGKQIDELASEPIDSLSVDRLIAEISKELDIKVRGTTSRQLVNEIEGFGINTIGQLRDVFTVDINEYLKKDTRNPTVIGLVRSALMLKDIEKYFLIPNDWGIMDENTYKVLLERYESRKLNSILKDNNITLLNSDEEEIDFSNDEFLSGI